MGKAKRQLGDGLSTLFESRVCGGRQGNEFRENIPPEAIGSLGSCVRTVYPSDADAQDYEEAFTLSLIHI